MDKKKAVGLAAILSSLLSGVLWIWYASIPSFDQANKNVDDYGDQTFQTENLNNEK